MRKIEFANNEYYHIYNRGVDKRKVFCDKKDYLRFLTSMREFNNKSTYEQRIFLKNRKTINQIEYSKKEFNSEASDLKSFLESVLPQSNLVEVICYCLNQNHYHLILKQLSKNGITLFMKKLGTGYTNYFNKKYNRDGSLFQGRFKSIHIDTNEYLLWLSGYVNGNVEIHKIAEAENYKWCSYQDYLNKRNGTLCNKEIILSQFKNIEEYKKYVEMVICESGKRKDLKKYFIE